MIKLEFSEYGVYQVQVHCYLPVPVKWTISKNFIFSLINIYKIHQNKKEQI